MVDFHSHVLPGIDDGSRNSEESIQMLSAIMKQGIDTVIATPHFDINNSSIDEFIEERRFSYERLSKHIDNDNFPKLILGAEVSYYPGIERLEDIYKLCFENSNIIMLEMPAKKWSFSTIESLRSLSLRGDLRVMIAHIERYYSFQDENLWKELSSNGVIMQSNASFFINKFSRRKAIKMLLDRKIDVLGSDCHNLTSRKPNLDEAFQLIEKKLGKHFFDSYNSFINNILF